ncbi:MAG: hypothetical protein NVSMB30_03160 [Hymenobacter sp.]
MLPTETLAEWAAARQMVHTRGLTYDTTTVSGDVMQYPVPEVAIASDAMSRDFECWPNLGCSPPAGGKVSALGDNDELDPFMQLLAQMKG